MKFLHFTLLAAALVFGTATYAQDRCHTMNVLARQLAENPALQQKMDAIESQTQAFVQSPIGTRAVSVTIPVVVHVLYNTAAQNITDAQVQTQITVLNADYAGTNSDISLLPSAFASKKAGATGVQFCLAKRDPSGNATTGIIHKSTATASFLDDDGAKSNSTGGDAAWDATKYLNIWVCNLGNGLLGYAQFPGGAAATDGVVILYSAFGSGGTAAAPYNKGRTVTHEVGHWLNLRHIWGDANCGDDLVSDTPTQQTSNFGCPTYPHVTCSNGTTGDLFMNYMDYVDDACMYMFSGGQSSRMGALFATNGARASLLTSQGCVAPTTTTTCAVPTSLTATSITATTATLGWAAVAGATSYSVQYRLTSATTWATVTATTNSIAFTGLVASTAYTFQVKANCSATLSSAYSTTAAFTTLASNPSPTGYCASAATTTTDEYINQVAFKTINNTSGNNNGYGDYTSLVAGVKPGTSFTLTITPKWTSTKYNEGYKVWIDYNRNGVFDAAEAVLTIAPTQTSPVTGTITVPTTASLGYTRMRIQMQYNSSATTACQTYTYGEVEDYTINLSSTATREAGDLSELNEMNSLALYPNPTNDNLAIDLDYFNGTALHGFIFDISGKELRTLTLTNRTNEISVSEMPAGMYFIAVQNYGGQVITRKFVKN